MEIQEKIEKKLKISLWKGVLFCLVIALVFLGLGYFLGNSRVMPYAQKIVMSIHSVRENNQLYHFIYPLLLYDFGDARQFLTEKPLSQKLNNYILSEYKNKNAESVSVVFRGLPDGSRVTINENTQYHPGSLLKVLIMMAYFREAEADSKILNKPLVYNKGTSQETTSVAFSLPTTLVVGQSYTTQRLIEEMIGNSDNGAQELLLDNVDSKTLDQAYVDLGVPSPDSVSADYTISDSQYGGFLRILYNSTYLTEEYSEQALSIMSQSKYRDGISAGVPEGITISQKYGERVDGTEKNVQAIELHDCGIIYAKDHPYELCIMTRGTDIDKLTSIIKNISSIVYNYVDGGK